MSSRVPTPRPADSARRSGRAISTRAMSGCRPDRERIGVGEPACRDRAAYPPGGGEVLRPGRRTVRGRARRSIPALGHQRGSRRMGERSTGSADATIFARDALGRLAMERPGDRAIAVDRRRRHGDRCAALPSCRTMARAPPAVQRGPVSAPVTDADLDVARNRMVGADVACLQLGAIASPGTVSSFKDMHYRCEAANARLYRRRGRCCAARRRKRPVDAGVPLIHVGGAGGLDRL